MSSPALTRLGTWALIAACAFAAGLALVHFTGGEPKVLLANAPPHDVVSRALDSEMEVSPTLAAQKDGTLAVAWIAMGGGREATGRYVGVRVSEPNAGKLGPLIRVTAPGASEATIVPFGDAFLLTWLAGGNVYAARISRGGWGAPAQVATSASRARAVSTGDTVYVAFAYDEGGKKGIALATSHDGATFARREVSSDVADDVTVCGDDHVALVTTLEDKRGVSAHEVPVDPEGPVSTSVVSSIGEHVAHATPACFVNGQDAFVVYGLTEKPQDPAESVVVDSLVFAHSKDGGKNFLVRAPYRPSSRVLNPTILHGPTSFTLLGVMGSSIGDAHASASVIVLSADGRSQNGLTRTVIAPVTMVVSRDAAGWTGDSLGLVDASGVTWTAVVDNAAGESHVALVKVL